MHGLCAFGFYIIKDILDVVVLKLHGKDRKLEDLQSEMQMQSEVAMKTDEARVRLELVSKSQQLELAKASQVSAENASLQASIEGLKHSVTKVTRTDSKAIDI